jgi:ABC-type branched-subunit amino acid transport system ATPase component
VLKTGRVTLRGKAAEIRNHPEIRSAYLGM